MVPEEQKVENRSTLAGWLIGWLVGRLVAWMVLGGSWRVVRGGGGRLSEPRPGRHRGTTGGNQRPDNASHSLFAPHKGGGMGDGFTVF